MAEGRWGEPLDPSLAHAGVGLPSTSPHPFPEDGLVLRAYPRDHPRNASKMSVECDVLLARTMITLNHIPVAQSAYGDDGSEWVPKATSRPLTLDTAHPFDGADGDRVIVWFLGGYTPFIFGQLPKPRWGSWEPPGYAAEQVGAGEDEANPNRQLRGQLQGVRWQVDRNGNLLVHVAGNRTIRLGPNVGGDLDDADTTLNAARRTDTVEVTIPPNTVLIRIPNPAPPPATLDIPNPGAITLSGTITGGTARVKLG